MSEASLHQLEREAEAARAKLANDLATLTSPRTFAAFKDGMKAEAVSAKDAIIENAKSSVTSTFQQVVDDLKAKAMANPTAALAIGAGIAWRLARRPPIATALVGAGLYSLLRTVPSEHPAQTAAMSQAVEAADAATVKVKEWSAQASALAHESTEKVKQWSSQAGGLAQESVEKVQEWGSQVGSLAQESADKMKEWGSQATDTTASIANRASNLIGDTQQAATEMAARTTAIANHAPAVVKEALQDEVVRDKILLGTAALAVAAALGMAYQRRANAGE